MGGITWKNSMHPTPVSWKLQLLLHHDAASFQHLSAEHQPKAFPTLQPYSCSTMQSVLPTCQMLLKCFLFKKQFICISLYGVCFECNVVRVELQIHYCHNLMLLGMCAHKVAAKTIASSYFQQFALKDKHQACYAATPLIYYL